MRRACAGSCLILDFIDRLLIRVRLDLRVDKLGERLRLRVGLTVRVWQLNAQQLTSRSTRGREDRTFDDRRARFSCPQRGGSCTGRRGRGGDPMVPRGSLGGDVGGTAGAGRCGPDGGVGDREWMRVVRFAWSRGRSRAGAKRVSALSSVLRGGNFVVYFGIVVLTFGLFRSPPSRSRLHLGLK